MRKKGIPNALKDKQEEQKCITKRKVQEAIDIILKEEGVVTKKKLLELTGLSPATFSKPHVKEVLKINKVCQFKTKNTIKKSHDEMVAEQLYLKITKLEKEKNMLLSKLQDKEIIVLKYKSQYNELEENYNIILGKIHIIMRKLDENCIDIGIDFDNL